MVPSESGSASGEGSPERSITPANSTLRTTPTPLVLIVDGDVDTATVLRRDLQAAGYETAHAGSVMQGLTLAREHDPDLVLLELNLPDGNGREVLARLKRTIGLRVIVLTANDSIGEKVELLDLGANDYVVKPYNPGELLARVAVQLRTPPSDTLCFREVELSLLKRLVTWKGIHVDCGPTELRILALLMANPGKVYSRADIHEVVWGKESPYNSNLVDVHIANIRSKLRDVGLYRFVRTVRGIGYALKT
ncbi:response regulator transcription factor (plasmid) [Deinococcus radiomollis]|uniref:response regulator transcription factor n=1 Tax=Deinococcus radiomollis TaxID=468916 RepID=UPI003892AC58